MRKIIKAPRGALLAILMAVLGLAVTAPAAQAADPYIYVFNDANSAESIIAWSNNPYYRITVPRGDYRYVNDRGGNARVDVDPAGGVDIDSYQIFTDCYPFGCTRIYGPCHNGENGSSNPDSSHVRVSHYVTKPYACGSGTAPFGSAVTNAASARMLVPAA